MFFSTLLLIPWIIFGFRNPSQRFLGLTQTKKSLTALLIVEILYFATLVLVLDKPDPDASGQGSFGWTYAYIYEKGIFPLFMTAELIHGTLGDRIDSNYPILYLPTALLMDYIVLKLISPGVFRFKRLIRNG